MDLNRKFIDFRELLSNETKDGGQIVVIPCGNVRKAETLMNSPKIMDPSKISIHVGVNDIHDQYLEDITSNLVTIARNFEKNSSARYTYQTLHREMTISKATFKQ